MSDIPTVEQVLQELLSQERLITTQVWTAIDNYSSLIAYQKEELRDKTQKLACLEAQIAEQDRIIEALQAQIEGVQTQLPNPSKETTP